GMHRREDVFGPEADPRLPDIVLRLADDVEGANTPGRSRPSASPPPGPHDTLGYHSRNGILVMAGDGVRGGASGPASLQDVAPTVLSYMGVPLPGSIEGRSLGQFFDVGT